MKKNISFITALVLTVFVFASCISFSGCAENSAPSDESIIKPSPVTTVYMEETTTTTTTTTSTTTSTTTKITTTTTTVSTTYVPVTKELLIDSIPEASVEPQNFTAPCGDISNAYVCICGAAIYPSVYVLSPEETRKLSNIINSFEWEQCDKKPVRVRPESSSDLEFYINNNGKCSQLSSEGDEYYVDKDPQYYTYRPTGEMTISLHEIASDFLSRGSSDRVGTHLWEQTEMDYSEQTKQDYWDLIWNDVIPYMESKGN